MLSPERRTQFSPGGSPTSRPSTSHQVLGGHFPNVYVMHRQRNVMSRVALPEIKAPPPMQRMLMSRPVTAISSRPSTSWDSRRSAKRLEVGNQPFKSWTSPGVPPPCVPLQKKKKL